MKKEDIKIEKLLDIDETIAKSLFKKSVYPFEVLKDISNFIIEFGSRLGEEYNKINDDIWIHKSVNITSNVTLNGPLIICENADIRPGAFFRGNVIIGKNVVAGNSCEFKNSIIFNDAQIPHFSYVGDSIIGYKAHLGASSITSNLKSDKTNVVLHLEDEEYNTNLRKLGAIVGDFVEVGCGSILNPGTIIGRNTNIYPLSSVRGCIDSDSIYKDKNNIIKKKTH
jgi:hypothetical protein